MPSCLSSARRRAGAEVCCMATSSVAAVQVNSLLLRRPAAVDHEGGAGHQRGGVGGEEHACAGQVLDLAEAAELDLAQDLLAERLVREERLCQRRLDEGGAERVDADGVRRTVYCASKHAMEGFTKAMAVELAPHAI